MFVRETRCLTDDLDGGRGVDAAALVAGGAGVHACVLLPNPLDAERAVGVVQLHPCRETQRQLDTHANTRVHARTQTQACLCVLTSALISTFGFVTSVYCTSYERAI